MTLRSMDSPHATETASTADADRFLAAVAVDGEVLFAGPSVPPVLGVDREALVGDDFLEHVHPNGRTAVSDAISAVAVDRRVVHRIRHANGGYVWVESVVDDELAPEFGGRVVTSRRVDVDGTFPERYRAFLEYGTDIVTVVDEDGRVRYESPSVEEVLGYEQGSLVGRSPLGYVHPDDRDESRRSSTERSRIPTPRRRWSTDIGPPTATGSGWSRGPDRCPTMRPSVGSSSIHGTSPSGNVGNGGSRTVTSNSIGSPASSHTTSGTRCR